MKKYFVKILTAIVLCISITACVNSPKSIIQATVNASNKQCPQHLGNSLTCTNIEFDGFYVIYNYEDTDGSYMNQDNVTPAKNNIIQTLKSQAQVDSSMKIFIDALKKANVGIIYHYSAPGASMDVVIESIDLSV